MFPEKRKHIFALCRELGFSDEQRKLIQYSATGKESMTEMNNRDADNVIKTLVTEKRKLKKNKPGSGKKMTPAESIKPGQHKNYLPHGDNIITLMTWEQYAKIKALSIHLTGSFSEEAMNKFTQRQFKKPLRYLTSNQAISLIETQKKMLSRKIKNKGGNNDFQ
ncbi:MAG: regulatory protein GemA [Leptospirales bacterium]|nr:regulatory protein GemA [Leptospirales bacterium]